jgi:hypothetical protein
VLVISRRLKMVRTIKVAATVLSIFSFTAMETVSVAAADSVSIGTVSARGDFRVDSHLVSGNATLFNGSVVETGNGDSRSPYGQGRDDYHVHELPRHTLQRPPGVAAGRERVDGS